MTSIEWVKNGDGSRGQTWNPIVGCSRISAGCQHCYSEKMTKRLEAMGKTKYAGLLNEQGRFNGVTRLDEDALLIPLRRKKPTTYFVNSMSDLFHESIPDEWIDKVFAVMALSPQHTFQCLTKRADRMERYFQSACLELIAAEAMWLKSVVWDARGSNKALYPPNAGDVSNRRAWPGWPLPNVWLGVSTENQEQANARIPHLLDTPAAVRFVSAEPLLGTIDFSMIEFENERGQTECWHALDRLPEFDEPGTPNTDPILDWIIVGGESGPGARPCNVDWIRSIVGQCKAADVPVFVKQLGSRPVSSALSESVPFPVSVGMNWNGMGVGGYSAVLKSRKGGDPDEWPEDLRVREMPEVYQCTDDLRKAAKIKPKKGAGNGREKDTE